MSAQGVRLLHRGWVGLGEPCRHPLEPQPHFPTPRHPGRTQNVQGHSGETCWDHAEGRCVSRGESVQKSGDL